MNCPIKSQENQEWLLDYAAGRLDGGRAALVERHVETCAECARFVREQQLVWNALGEWAPRPVSDAFDRRLYGAADQVYPPSWLVRIFGPFHPWPRAVAPLMAAACLVIVAGVLLRTPQATLVPPNAAVRQRDTGVEKIDPEQVERTLDDIEMLRELAVMPPPLENTPNSM